MQDVQLSTLGDALRKVFMDTSKAAFQMRPYRKIPTRTDDSLLGVGEKEADICACQTHSVPREELRMLADGHKKNVILHHASQWFTKSLLLAEESYLELSTTLGHVSASRQVIDAIRQFFEFNVDHTPEIFREWTVRALHSEVKFVSQRVDSGSPVDPGLIDLWEAIATALAHVFRREFEIKLKALLKQEVERLPVEAKLVSNNPRQAVVSPILKRKGWSTLEWAQNANLDWHTADRYLKNVGNPCPSTRKKLADSLGLQCEELPE
jgi:hypothetical protein